MTDADLGGSTVDAAGDVISTSDEGGGDDVARAAYADLLAAMSDEDPDVTADHHTLLVRGRPFGWLDGDALRLRLPAERAGDLDHRGVAARVSGSPSTVRVIDMQLWPELASESRDYVGEPAVGGRS